MDEQGNESPVEEVTHRGLTIRWEAEDMATFERAARLHSEREHGDFTKTDIIRMGARRLAAEILSESAA